LIFEQNQHDAGMSAQTEAEEHLRYIRDVMDRSSQFSAISGIGLVLVGLMGLTTGIVTILRNETPIQWLAYWIIVAGIAFGVGTTMTMRKARSSGTSAVVGPGRKFALCLAPALVAGGALTFGLYQVDAFALMPAAWLLIYGAGLTAGGTYSIGHVHRFGLAFIAIGVLAVLTSPDLGDVWMAVGFGGLHLLMGAWIMRRHGG
jgi:hypothetical protein